MNYNLFKITTKFGSIYIEPPIAAFRDEEDRIKIYDSKKRYIDYIPVDGADDVRLCQEWANYVADICNAEDFETLLNRLVGGDDNWSFYSDNVNDVLDMMLELEEWNSVREDVIIALTDQFGTPIVTSKIEEDYVRWFLEEDDLTNNEWIIFIGHEIVLLYEY